MKTATVHSFRTKAQKIRDKFRRKKEKLKLE